LRAVLYSGFCSKRVLCSRVETSSSESVSFGARWRKRVMADERTFVSLLEFWLGRKV
jgi:hypothetical protein